MHTKLKWDAIFRCGVLWNTGKTLGIHAYICQKHLHSKGCVILWGNFYPRTVLAFLYCHYLRLYMCLYERKCGWVCMYQSRVCPCGNSWPVQARITKFEPAVEDPYCFRDEIQLKIQISLKFDNIFLKSGVTHLHFRGHSPPFLGWWWWALTSSSSTILLFGAVYWSSKLGYTSLQDGDIHLHHLWCIHYLMLYTDLGSRGYDRLSD